jgi:cytochrome b561
VTGVALPRAAPARFSALTIFLHWFMLLLVAAAYATIELRELFPKGSDPREAMKAWHFMLGLSVLAFLAVRLAARLAGPTPPIAPPPARWQQVVAGLAHAALYLFLLIMPLLGWLALSADGKAISFFGLPVPPLVGPDGTLAERAEELHELGGTIGYFLIGLHAAAALAHHYLFHDNPLRRMLPGRSEGAREQRDALRG